MPAIFVFTCIVYVVIFSLWNCHCFEPAGNLMWFISGFVDFPTPLPLLSSLSHNENKYCKRHSFLNILCTVVTVCMYITLNTCSTVTVFKYVCQTLPAARGASNPKSMNEMHRTQFDHACLVRNSLTHNFFQACFDQYMYHMKLNVTKAQPFSVSILTFSHCGPHSATNLRSGSIFVSLWKLNSVRENVWEPLKLGLISGYSATFSCY